MTRHVMSVPLTALLLITAVGVSSAPAAAWRRPLPAAGGGLLDGGRLQLGIHYEHEETREARRDTGDDAPNAAREAVNFDTTVFLLRYGLSDRANLVLCVPYHSADSDKIQGEPYRRVNKGLGDVTLTTDIVLNAVPRIVVEAGLEVPTGDIERTDRFGQRFADVLALGSGTTDFILGGGLWVPDVGLPELDVVARLRHRFAGGENKFGYRFGEETDLAGHATYPISDNTRLGLQVEGYHTESDTWHGNRVPDRGGTILYAGPTISYSAPPLPSLGVFARFPLLMRLEGEQMLAPAIIGLHVSTDVTRVLDWVAGGGE